MLCVCCLKHNFCVLALSGFILNPERYTHCRPCEFDLSDLQGKKEIAATTRNSDGWPHNEVKSWYCGVEPLLWLSLFLCLIKKNHHFLRIFPWIPRNDGLSFNFFVLVLFRLAAHLQPVLIFFPGSQTAPDVALGFVYIQYFTGLLCQVRINGI